MKAKIALEDGSEFEGVAIGPEGERTGEVVLNTAVVGYQEMMTDPTNAGKILVLTYPLIGNYGIAKKFNESKKCWLAGLAIKESSRIYSNWQAEGSFEDFIDKEGVLAIAGIDTRTLATTIRDKGEMFGIISTKNSKKGELLDRIKEAKSDKTDFIKSISVNKPAEIRSGPQGAKIAVLDLGILNSFTRQLCTLGCNITLLPYDTSSKYILGQKYDGLVISNGPENDKSLDKVALTVKELIGKIPMMGIATGHEAIGLALGASLAKMRIGHHGVNYPIKPPDSLKGSITVQNHSYIIDEGTLKNRKDVSITARNVNDNTIEELESRALKFISTQYNPASAGFNEVNDAFLRFMKIAGKSSRIKTNLKFSNEVQYAKA